MALAPIDVHELLGRPGASRRHDVIGTIEGLSTELVAVPDDAPLGGSLLLESVVEGILVSGSIAGTWRLRCARCLVEWTEPFSIRVQELYTSEDRQAEADPDDDLSDEVSLLVDDTIDLEQMIRDTVGVEMPFAPLHDERCQGLCEICGRNRNLGECPGHDAIDPRFAVLSDLLPDLPETSD
jgi:uncharacterized protein